MVTGGADCNQSAPRLGDREQENLAIENILVG